jgi:Rifampin ADP-ribosyl transferase
VRLFHGGTRKLHRGDVLLPPERTGAPTTADFGAAGVCRPDRVYLTTDLEAARLFAIMAPPKGNGSVYEVEPIGDLEVDPDYLAEDESAYAVPMARILRVVERRVTDLHGLDMHQVAAICSSDGDSYPTSERFAALGQPPHQPDKGDD